MNMTTKVIKSKRDNTFPGKILCFGHCLCHYNNCFGIIFKKQLTGYCTLSRLQKVSRFCFGA